MKSTRRCAPNSAASSKPRSSRTARRGKRKASCRARCCAGWASSVSSASAIRPSTAAPKWTRSARWCWRRSSAARPSAASPSPCWCIPTWPRCTSPMRDRRRRKRALCRTSSPAAPSPRLPSPSRTRGPTSKASAPRRGATATITSSTAPRCSSPTASTPTSTFVAAKTSAGGRPRNPISMFMVEKGTPGFRVGRALDKHGWRSSDTAELVFENCRIPARKSARRAKAAASTPSCATSRTSAP